MNHSEPRTRTEEMTVYKIGGNLMNVTQIGDEESRWLLSGPIMVYAIGRSSSHEWPLRDGQRCWIGDKVSVVIEERTPTKVSSTSLTPPRLVNET